MFMVNGKCGNMYCVGTNRFQFLSNVFLKKLMLYNEKWYDFPLHHVPFCHEIAIGYITKNENNSLFCYDTSTPQCIKAF